MFYLIIPYSVIKQLNHNISLAIFLSVESAYKALPNVAKLFIENIFHLVFRRKFEEEEIGLHTRSTTEEVHSPELW